MGRRPVIGVTPDLGETAPRPGRPAQPRYELKQAYADAVLAAGGLPVVLPYSDDEAAAEEAVALCDALVVTGGAFDIPPEAYGAGAHRLLGPLKRGRTQFEQRHQVLGPHERVAQGVTAGERERGDDPFPDHRHHEPAERKRTPFELGELFELRVVCNPAQP